MDISTAEGIQYQNVNKVTFSKQLFFYAPLAITSLLVTMTHSLFNAGLARLPSPEILLSAFAVGKSIMNLFQSPVMMVTQTVTPLVKDRESYFTVRKFMLNLAILVTLASALFSLTGIDRWVLVNIMGLEGRVLRECLVILKVFIIFPASVTVRNFIQGICITFRVTSLFTVATIVRLLFVGTMVAFIQKMTLIPPAVLAGLMLLGAGSIESLVIYIGSKLTVGNVPKELELMKQNNPEGDTGIVTNRLILSFFLPLVLTSFISMLSTPIVNMGLARSISPEIALSTYSVAWGLGMIVISPLGMFHQMPLNFIEGENKDSIKSVKIFGLTLALVSSLLVGIMGFTNVGLYILRNLIGATEEISRLSMDVLKLMVIYPFVVIAREFFWGTLMRERMTSYISKGKIVNSVSLTLTILLMLFICPVNSAIIGAVGMISGEGMEFLFLFLMSGRAEKMEILTQE